MTNNSAFIPDFRPPSKPLEDKFTNDLFGDESNISYISKVSDRDFTTSSRRPDGEPLFCGSGSYGEYLPRQK
jgi:hypothetical protein